MMHRSTWNLLALGLSTLLLGPLGCDQGSVPPPQGGGDGDEVRCTGSGDCPVGQVCDLGICIVASGDNGDNSDNGDNTPGDGDSPGGGYHPNLLLCRLANLQCRRWHLFRSQSFVW
ncbi:MAG: hypothetical protein R3C68_08005 [Myxococcota bacterium]